MIREELLSRLKEDLIGPADAMEMISARPSDQYLTGILWPKASVPDEDEDALLALDDPDAESAITLTDQQRPSNCGLSFCLPNDGQIAIRIDVRFGRYLIGEHPSDKSLKKSVWVRQGESISQEVTVGLLSTQEIKIFEDEVKGLTLSIYVREESRTEGRIVTVIAVNNSETPTSESTVEHDERSVFQFELKVALGSPHSFLPLPTSKRVGDEEYESSKLLYRKQLSFATGLQCSAVWHERDAVNEVMSTWIPTETIPSFSSDGDKVFDELAKSNALAARKFASDDISQTIATLQKLCAAYELWIKQERENSINLPFEFRETAERHLVECMKAEDRMRRCIDLLEENQELAKAFVLANRAMALQYDWKEKGLKELTWRPFQIGFILLCLESTINPDSSEREIFDLLWFPTGGGKTEAYLGLIAVAAFYRAVKGKFQSPSGCVSLMRYTLRLLTAQQFQRATALILACEVVARFESQTSRIFSIGLWVGGDATPNSYKDAVEESNPASSPRQLETCPACGSKLLLLNDRVLRRFRPACKSEECVLGGSFGEWPVCTVDDDVYATRPTLVIGTIDKFSQLPFQPLMKTLFDFRGPNAPDLIIQDELHLISGPLGTIAGLYEMALDWLLLKDGKKPKIIGSTATIRRATSQVRALFDRESFQFPPAGLDFSSSGFACIDENAPGRLYAGVTTAGRSAKFTIQAVAGSLAQSAKQAYDASPTNSDGYMTELMYFNSLRELGGAVVQGQDDIPDSIFNYAERRNENARKIAAPMELTSRVSQQEILETLAALEKTHDTAVSPDLVLATNMVSVGVDVPRLALMILQGTPKARAEYIQASSRVGRSSQAPGLVLCVYNAAKARDRSQFESFKRWHDAIYRDVEPTSVTPFASRARDKALHAALVAMVRHSIPGMLEKPVFSQLTPTNLQPIIDFIQERSKSVDSEQAIYVAVELEDLLDDWHDRRPEHYKYDNDPDVALMQSAEVSSKKVAQGRLPAPAWPTMNNMRSVEASTPFRLTEFLKNSFVGIDSDGVRRVRNWRRPADG